MNLKLNKLSRGRYTNRVGDVLISVEKEHISGLWIGKIEVFTHLSKDLIGNNVEMFDELLNWKSTTKKEVSKALLEFIENN